MDQGQQRSLFVEGAFWTACGLAAIGALGPLLFAAGNTNRIAVVGIPFGVAAALLAILALTCRRGRGFASLLYFAAGVGIIYGLLLVLSVPVRVAVVGSCQVATECAPGTEPQLSGAESSAIGFAVALGMLALIAGFFGLLMLYRRTTRRAIATATPVWPDRPPEKPTAPKPSTDEPAPEPTKEEVVDTPESPPQG